MKSIAIVGAGGMARDALVVLNALGLAGRVKALYESDSVWKSREVAGLPVRPLSTLAKACSVVVAVGDGGARRRLVSELAPTTDFPTMIHPSVIVGRSVEIDAGTLICAGCILTCDIHIGVHVQLNIGTTVTHDCVIGSFVTTAPGVRLSGKCRIGSGAFLGTNSCLRESVEVAESAVIGMGAVVTRSIGPGVWIGNPARRVR